MITLYRYWSGIYHFFDSFGNSGKRSGIGMVFFFDFLIVWESQTAAVRGSFVHNQSRSLGLQAATVHDDPKQCEHVQWPRYPRCSNNNKWLGDEAKRWLWRDAG